MIMLPFIISLCFWEIRELLPIVALNIFYIYGFFHGFKNKVQFQVSILTYFATVELHLEV